MKKTIVGLLLVLNIGAFASCADKNGCQDETVVEQVYTQSVPVAQNQCHVNETMNVCEQEELFVQDCPIVKTCDNYLARNSEVKVSVFGQGVAPCDGTCSPAQAYALAKRAAIADGYRLIAEKIKGVYVEGDDVVKNMMIKRSTVRTWVSATIRNANIVETTFKDGLCEVEMELTLSHAQFYR